MAGNQQGSRTEEIDERILQLLGLGDTFDLDYDDYNALLKEKLIEISRGGGKTSTEDAMLLREEMKRAKQKKGEGTFKAKKKINKDSFTAKKKIPGVTTTKKTPLLLSGTKSEKTSKKVEEKSKKVSEKKSEEDNSIYSSIIKSLDNIIKILSDQLNFDKKESENQRKLVEREKRKEKEGKMESAFSKGLQAISKVASKVLDPLREFFNRLINFVVWTFLGVAFKKFMNWYKDPENEKKLDTIGKLIKDFWPAILTGVLAFMTPLGGLVLWMSKTLIGWTANLLKIVLPNLLKFLGKLGWKGAAVLGGAALFGAGAAIPKLFPQTVDEQERKTEAAPGSKEEKIEKLKKQKESLNPLQRLQGVGAEIDEQIYKLETGETKRYEFGGFVSGKKGIDQIPAMLSDGEFVMSRGAVQKYGADTLAAMNAAGGGTNRPVTANGVTRATGGGLIGRDKRGRNTRADETASNVPTAPHKEPGLPETSSKPKTQESKPGSHAYLTKLNDKNIKKVSAPSGYCVTGTLNTMQASGVPNPPATGNDVGNNPRGGAVQLIKNFGWKSIGGTNTTLKSPYGTVSTGIFSKGAYDTAVKEGKVPSGAIIFQTRHSSWNGTSHKSRGYDMAIAQKNGKALWNGVPLGQWVYGNTKKVIALTPGGVTGDGKPGEFTDSDTTESGAGVTDESRASEGQDSGATAPTLSMAEFNSLMSKEFSPNEMASSVISNNSGLMKEKMGEFSPNEMASSVISNNSGLIKENTGVDAQGGGADRRLLRGQPGEYILPVGAVQGLGGSSRIDKLVANLDSNSNAAKMGLRNKDISQGIRPYDVNSSGGVDVSSMPLSMGGKSGPNFMTQTGSNDEFHAPFFDGAFAERQRILDTIGISAFG